MSTPHLALLAWIATASAFLTPRASAALIAADWQHSGDALLTFDPQTNLQWLDVTVTRGLSWNTLQAELKPGGRFAGFRGPTDAEVVQFWSHAQIPVIRTNGVLQLVPENRRPVADLQALWGDTGYLPWDPAGVLATWVTTGESFDPVDKMVEGSALLRRIDTDGIASAQMRVLLGQPPDVELPYAAHALVRPVPEPGTLIVIPLLACAPRRRRRLS